MADRKNKTRGLAKLEQLLLIATVAWLGTASFTDLGRSFGATVAHQVSATGAQLQGPVEMASKSAASLFSGMAKLAREAAEMMVGKGNRVVQLADLPSTSKYLQPDIPLTKLDKAVELLDPELLARVPDRQLKSVDDIVVIDVEVTSNRSRGAAEYAQQWGVGEIGVAYVEGGKVQTQRLDLDYVDGHVASRRLAEREFRDLIDYEQGMLRVAEEAFDKELGFYNAAWDTKRLLQGIDDEMSEGMTRLSRERYDAVAKVDALRKADAEKYNAIRAQVSELLADYRDQRAKGTQKDLAEWRTKVRDEYDVDADDFLLSELRHRLKTDEHIDVLDAVRMFENDGRGNKLEPTSLRVLPNNSPFALAEDTAHFGDADAAATLEIARQSRRIKNELESDLPAYLRRQIAARELGAATRQVVGGGIEGDPLLRRKLSGINFGFIEVASTKPRGQGSYGQLTKIGFGERSPRTSFTQVGDRYVPSFVMDGIGDDELFVRPVKYKTPNARKHQPRSFVDADIDNQATRQSGIEDSTVRGERVLGEAPQPTLFQLWEDGLPERLDEAQAWVSYRKEEEVGVFNRELAPIVHIEGVDGLPESLQRQFVGLEQVILNLLDDESKKMLRMKLNLSADAELRLPVRKAYELITGEKIRAPTGSIAQNARITRVIFEKLQSEGGLGSTFGDLLKIQEGTDVRPRLYYDNGRIRVRGGR